LICDGITNLTLLISVEFIVAGFSLINRFDQSMKRFAYHFSRRHLAAPEPMPAGYHAIAQKHLYTGLFFIGYPGSIAGTALERNSPKEKSGSAGLISSSTTMWS
jgi:hypothetical protein